MGFRHGRWPSGACPAPRARLLPALQRAGALSAAGPVLLRVARLLCLLNCRRGTQGNNATKVKWVAQTCGNNDKAARPPSQPLGRAAPRPVAADRALRAATCPLEAVLRRARTGGPGGRPPAEASVGHPRAPPPPSRRPAPATRVAGAPRRGPAAASLPRLSRGPAGVCAQVFVNGASLGTLPIPAAGFPSFRDAVHFVVELTSDAQVPPACPPASVRVVCCG